MEIRNLITFVQVAELNSFTRAAQTLDYSQSTVSFQIKQLESELDCLLFERINHTITLTDRGRELLEYAKQIRTLTDQFHQERRGESQLTGFLHLVTPDSVCEDMMLANYFDFHARYPGISLKFTTGDTADMFRMLDRNEADLMFTLDSHVYQNDYIIAKEEPVPMHFVTGAGTRYDTGRTLTLEEAAAMPFLLTEKGMGYRKVFDKIMARRSLEIRPILELGRTDVIMSMLEGDVGISYLPDFATRKRVEQGRLVYLDVPGMEPDIWKQLIHHKNKWISNALRALIDYIKAHEFKG